MRRKQQESGGLAQIVIVRKGTDVFKMTTFSGTECVGSEYLNGKETVKLLESELERLAVNNDL